MPALQLNPYSTAWALARNSIGTLLPQFLIRVSEAHRFGFPCASKNGSGPPRSFPFGVSPTLPTDEVDVCGICHTKLLNSPIRLSSPICFPIYLIPSHLTYIDFDFTVCLGLVLSSSSPFINSFACIHTPCLAAYSIHRHLWILSTTTFDNNSILSSPG